MLAGSGAFRTMQSLQSATAIFQKSCLAPALYFAPIGPVCASQ